MIIKFKNANILNKNLDIDYGMDLVVKDDKIEKIVKNYDDGIKYDRVVDCDGNYLIPGFKNGHAHNAMAFVRSYAEDLPLERWLTEQIFPLEAELTEEDVYYFTILGIMESLSSGITSCADMYKYYYSMADAYLKTGMRVNIVDSLMHFDKKIAPEEYYINLNNYKGDNGNIVKYTLALHAVYTNNETTHKLISDLVHKYKAPFFSHNSETVKEINDCKANWGGKTPTGVCEEYGLYDFGGGGYHGVYFDDNDIEIYKKHNLCVVTNPASNLKLASGIAPIKKYLDNGLNVAIGTDGQASNNTLDMFREMLLVSLLSKYKENNAESITSKEILKMAVKNGAYAICRDDIDSLDIGKKADIVLIDINKPNMVPNHNFVNNMIYACGKQNVKLTMVDGKILYEDGKFFINEDEQYIYKKCDTLVKNLIERCK